INYDPKDNGFTEGKDWRYIRIETSPQHFTADDFEAFMAWLSDRNRLGKLAYIIFEGAVITRVDVNIDIYGITPNDIFFDVLRLFSGTITFAKGARIDAARYGGKGSRRHL